jgi:uncharacterized protein involved in exopolysaccharide biosynthesis
MSTETQRNEVQTPAPLRTISASGRAYPDPDGGEREQTLVDLVWTLVENWRIVVSTVVVALLLASAYVVLAPPTFRSDTVVQVEDNQKTLPGLDDLQTMFIVL